MRRNYAFFIACAFALFFSPLNVRALGVLSVEDEALIKTMPLKTKIGQMLMIGFVGEDTEHGFASTIEKLRPGAVIIFKRNIKTARQISNLNLSAQKVALKTSGLPLLIATDQEGGDVARIQTASPLPSALALGRTDDPVLITRAGKATGTLMKTLGFNMNLAPVVDVGDPKKHLFIGTRSYGTSPELVAQSGERFADGLGSAGVLATAKHFPGHGSVSEDSHLEAPVVKRSLEEMKERDLVPFRSLAQNAHWPVAVMLAHISVPAIDPTGIPATFSKPIVTGVLRKQIGFDGLVVTDDIEMGGAQVIKSVRERAVRAVEAGADLIMVGWNKKTQAEVILGLEHAVSGGRITEARLNESLRRLLIAKRAFATAPSARPSDLQLQSSVRNPEFKLIARAVMESRFAKPLDQHEEHFRALTEDHQILVFSPNSVFADKFSSGLSSSDARKVRVFALGPNQRFQIDRVMNANPTAVGVIYVSGDRVANSVNQISSDVAARTLLVTSVPVGSFAHENDFAAIADVYYRHPDLGRWVAARYFNKELRVPAAQINSKTAETKVAKSRLPAIRK